MQNGKTGNKVSDTDEVSEGFSNPFEGLGSKTATDKLAKAMIARVIRDRVRSLEWTGARTAITLEIHASEASELLSGKLARFSQERLETFLNRLDLNVMILISPKPASQEFADVRVQYVEA